MGIKDTQRLSMIKITLLIFFLLLPGLDVLSFGFAAHRQINRMAVFTLPPEMIGFYKYHIEYLTERAVDPDKRAHAVPGEAPRHYIDIDQFGKNPFDTVPRQWKEAVKLFTEDTLQKHGVLPWHVPVVMQRLTNAFEREDLDGILYNSAHLGHYVADLCTPLHTSKYYNGKTEQQRGIHALWESRIVELWAESFNYMVGRASYIESPLDRAWELIEESHLKVDTIFHVFDSLMVHFPSDLIYTHESRGQTNRRNYSIEFAKALEEGMKGMVERRMRASVKSVGDYWYTAWVNAGQPDLNKIEKRAISKNLRKQLEEEEKKFKNIDRYQERPEVK